VQSYFRGNEDRGHIEIMMPIVADVDFQETDSVLEALILESNLIKKHQPKYNMKEKDDKSFSYFIVTEEDFPRILIVRKTDLDKDTRYKEQETNNFQNSKFKTCLPVGKVQNSQIYGPYTSKKQMEIALKIIRKIFPFHSRTEKSEKGCLDFQIGMCPGPYDGAISKEDYRKNIRGIRMILEGKKKSLVKKLEKEMQTYAGKNEFEKAAETRNKVFALNHIRDIALMSREAEDKNHEPKTTNLRVEAYDISNLSGQQAVGSIVVFEGNQPNKSEYRKFRIKTVEGANDVAMMKEVLLRRMKNDWTQPDLIILDGGKGHLNMADKLLRELGFAIPLVAVAKGAARKNLNLEKSDYEKMIGDGTKKEIDKVLQDKNLLKYITDEAHRFAIGYHRKIRKKEYLEG
jgi:excinuclease ABC subunit C